MNIFIKGVAVFSLISITLCEPPPEPDPEPQYGNYNYNNYNYNNGFGSKPPCQPGSPCGQNIPPPQPPPIQIPKPTQPPTKSFIPRTYAKKVEEPQNPYPLMNTTCSHGLPLAKPAPVPPSQNFFYSPPQTPAFAQPPYSPYYPESYYQPPVQFPSASPAFSTAPQLPIPHTLPQPNLYNQPYNPMLPQYPQQPPCTRPCPYNPSLCCDGALKFGYCPYTLKCPRKMFEPIEQPCYEDYDCSGNKKCCYDYCNTQPICLESVEQPHDHPGDCPNPEANCTSSFTYEATCSYDSQCEMNSKCCPQLCSSVYTMKCQKSINTEIKDINSQKLEMSKYSADPKNKNGKGTIQITVFISMLTAGARSFLQYQIEPVIDGVSSHVNLEILPLVKCKRGDGQEIKPYTSCESIHNGIYPGDALLACASHHLRNENEALLRYSSCLITNLYNAAADDFGIVNTAGRACAATSRKDRISGDKLWNELKQCLYEDEVESLLHESGEHLYEMLSNPSKEALPLVFIDKKLLTPLRGKQRNFAKVICSKLNNVTENEFCNKLQNEKAEIASLFPQYPTHNIIPRQNIFNPIANPYPFIDNTQQTLANNGGENETDIPSELPNFKPLNLYPSLYPRVNPLYNRYMNHIPIFIPTYFPSGNAFGNVATPITSNTDPQTPNTNSNNQGSNVVQNQQNDASSIGQSLDNHGSRLTRKDHVTIDAIVSLSSKESIGLLKKFLQPIINQYSHLIKLNIYPTQLSNQPKEENCKLDKTECLESKIILCADSVYVTGMPGQRDIVGNEPSSLYPTQQRNHLEFTICIIEAITSHTDTMAMKMAQTCAQASGMDWTQLETCARHDQGRLLVQDVHKNINNLIGSKSITDLPIAFVNGNFEVAGGKNLFKLRRTICNALMIKKQNCPAALKD